MNINPLEFIKSLLKGKEKQERENRDAAYRIIENWNLDNSFPLFDSECQTLADRIAPLLSEQEVEEKKKECHDWYIEK